MHSSLSKSSVDPIESETRLPLGKLRPVEEKSYTKARKLGAGLCLASPGPDTVSTAAGHQAMRMVSPVWPRAGGLAGSHHTRHLPSTRGLLGTNLVTATASTVVSSLISLETPQEGRAEAVAGRGALTSGHAKAPTLPYPSSLLLFKKKKMSWKYVLQTQVSGKLL